MGVKDSYPERREREQNRPGRDDNPLSLKPGVFTVQLFIDLVFGKASCQYFPKRYTKSGSLGFDGRRNWFHFHVAYFRWRLQPSSLRL